MGVSIPPGIFQKRIFKKKFPNRIRNYFLAHVTEFCKTTTIHGFSHIVAPKRHWLEKLLWIAIVTAATSFASAIIYRSYSRYRKDPTVISIDKDFRLFEVHFPGTTFCFENKFNQTKAEEIVKSKWNLSKGDARFEIYMNFLQTLSNSSYENLKDFERFSNLSNLGSENLAKLMQEVNFGLTEEVIKTFENGSLYLKYHETLTEMGICYSFNSFITPHLKPGGILNQISKNLKALPRIPKCTYVESNCFAKMIRGERPLKFYVHSPYELPDSSSKYGIAISGYDTEATYTYLSIKADPILKDLKIRQRKCHFRDESRLPESPYYSFTLCRMNCRRRLAMELCKCVPHFYVKRANQPYCDLKGLICLSKNHTYISKLITDNGANKYPCPCYASCSDTDYIADKKDRIAMGSLKESQYKYAIERFSKTIIKRTIIFGIEDLLVSLGGTANLFLGCSIMSGVELIYFFTLRLARYMIRKSFLKKAKTGKKRIRKFTLNRSDLLIG